jgi:CHASE2 domain
MRCTRRARALILMTAVASIAAFCQRGIQVRHADHHFTRKSDVTTTIATTTNADDPTTPSSALTVVLIDDKTENALGDFPYDRKVLADAIERAALLNAKAVVLKFFVDLPSTKESDQSLALAMTHIPVVLESCFVPEGSDTHNNLPDRFFIDLGGDIRAVGGFHAWNPIRRFADRAADIGFVSYVKPDSIPIIERYGDHYVKSLWLCCFEQITHQRAYIEPGKAIRIGNRTHALNEFSELPIRFPSTDYLRYISFIDFIKGAVPADEITGHVVILGYDGKAMATVPTPAGRMKKHREFCLCLIEAMYELDSISNSPSTTTSSAPSQR